MINFKLPKLVIFDMDGTMLDTEPTSLAAMIRAGKEMGYEITQEVGESLMGKSIVWCKRILREQYGEGFDIEKALRLHKVYTRAFYEKNGIPTKAGLYPMLDKLESLGIKKCVATSTAKESAMRKLESVNIAHRFEVIIGGDEVKNGKPAPDIFLKAAESCNTAPEDCVILEDTEAGALGATAAGIRLILIPDIAPLNEEIRAKAFALCTDLNEVAEMFI